MTWCGLSRILSLALAAAFVFGSVCLSASGAMAGGLFGRAGQAIDRPAEAANDVDARQGSIHERLRDAMEAGRLTDQNLHTIREQLEKVAAQEAVYKSKNGEMNSFQSMQLQSELDKISKELEADLTERKGGPVDVVALRNSIFTRLSNGLAAQKISQDDYNKYSGEIQAIDKDIEDSKGTDGKLATNDQLRIALKLDNLSQRFTAGEQQSKADMTTIDKRKDELRVMIRNGVAEGRLTEDEVDDLRQQLYTFEEREKRMGNIGRPLTPDEELSLALELERFGAEIRARMDNGTGVHITDATVDHRKAALDQTFANALFAGDITVAEATDFKNNLDQISADEAGKRTQNGGALTADETKDLLITVEKLKGRFSRLTYNRLKPWNGVDGMVNQMKQAINVAALKNQISAQESDDLQSKLADVLVAKSNERNTQGFVTTDSAIKLQAEISTLSDEITKLLADRSVLSSSSLQKRLNTIDHTMATAIDTGRLTPELAAPVMAQYKGVAASLSKLQGATIDTDNSALSSVSADIDKLALAVHTARHKNQAPEMSIDQLKAELDREITYRSFDGKISAKEQQNYRNQLNRIDLTEKNSRASATGLDATTAYGLQSDLTKLLKSIKATKPTAEKTAVSH